MLKVNNKDTRTAPLASFWCFHCQLRPYFTPCSSISIDNFEQDSDSLMRRAHTLRCLINAGTGGRLLIFRIFFRPPPPSPGAY